MPLLTQEPQITSVDAEQLALIRATVPFDALRGFYDDAFGKLPAAIASSGLAITGPPRGLTFGLPTDTIDVGVGFPVDGVVEVTDDVAPFQTPGGRAVTYDHRGNYDYLSDVYAELFAWIADHSLVRGDVVWEIYLTQPTPDADPEDMITQIVVPVSDAV